jgi:hypothetical protein
MISHHHFIERRHAGTIIDGDNFVVVGFEVLTAVVMKSIYFFWDITLYSPLAVK